ncbi:MAG: ATPase [Alphaproteobacteria bacterium]|nr:ATPase [Alphaproteobacteria bacterium]
MKRDDRPRRRRFYQTVDVTPVAGTFGVRLDGRLVKTPGKRALALPTMPLAEAVAVEWRAQGDTIEPGSMPLTRFANTAIDRVHDDPARVHDEALRFAGGDLVCYRVPDPPELAARQQAHWQPVADWLVGAFGVELQVTQELTAVTQSATAIARLRAAVAALDAFALVALHAIATATGSLALALAALGGRLDAAATAAAAHVEETWQEERWGADREAAERRAALVQEIAAAIRFARLAAGT